MDTHKKKKELWKNNVEHILLPLPGTSLFIMDEKKSFRFGAQQKI